MIWNDERVDALKHLWAYGLSASQIAARIGGVSRNSVIGKAHRLGLPLRGHAGNGRPRTSATPRNRKTMNKYRSNRLKNTVRLGTPVTISTTATKIARTIERDGIPIPTPAEADIPRVSFLDLNEDGKKHCKWICLDSVTGVPQDAPMFCGEEPEPGLVYCRAHALRAYSPVRPRQPSVPRVEMEKEVVVA